jgi:hypothetical protein
MRKQCSRCKVEKPAEEFGSNRSKHDGLNCYCKACRAGDVRKHYARNPQYRAATKERAAKRKRENKILIYQYLLKHSCIDCGEQDVIVLDFDHRDESSKVAGVSELARKCVRWEVIKAEIDKCDVRCSNCHRKRTAAQFGGYSLLEEAKRGLLIDSDVSVS